MKLPFGFNFRRPTEIERERLRSTWTFTDKLFKVVQWAGLSILIILAGQKLDNSILKVLGWVLIMCVYLTVQSQFATLIKYGTDNTRKSLGRTLAIEAIGHLTVIIPASIVAMSLVFTIAAVLPLIQSCK